MFNSFELKNQLREIWKEIKAVIDESNNEKLLQLYDEFYEKYNSVTYQDKIKLVICGEWSTGKSTIVKALTGKKDIEIGEDVTTIEVHEYNYDDFYIVDTPGFNICEKSHTAIAEKALYDSDCVIYCITEQQLFSDDSIEDFISTYNRVKNLTPLILVVTKLGSEGNDVINTMRAIDAQIEKDFKDHGFNGDYQTSFINAELYMIGKERGDDSLIERSYFQLFIEQIETAGIQLKQKQESLLKVKCKRQIAIMIDLITYCIEENKNLFTDEDQKKLDEENKRLSDNLIKEKNKLVKECNDTISEMLDILYSEDISIIEDKLKNKKTYIETIIQEAADEPISTEFNIDTKDLSDEKKAFSKRRRGNKKIDNKGLGKNVASLFNGIVRTINDKAAPVEIIKEKKILKKIPIKTKELSTMGGKGTNLERIASKFFHNKGVMISEKTAYWAQMADKKAEVINRIGVTVDIIIPVVSSIYTNYCDKKEFHAVYQARQTIKQEINKLSEECHKAIDEIYNLKMNFLYPENNESSSDPVEIEKKLNRFRVRFEDIKSQIDQSETVGDV